MKGFTAHAIKVAKVTGAYTTRVRQDAYGKNTCGDAFSFAAYAASYKKPHLGSRQGATLPEGTDLNAARRAIYQDAKRRLEKGVPVDVLIRDALLKLRLVRAGRKEVR